MVIQAYTNTFRPAGSTQMTHSAAPSQRILALMLYPLHTNFSTYQILSFSWAVAGLCLFASICCLFVFTLIQLYLFGRSLVCLNLLILKLLRSCRVKGAYSLHGIFLS